MFDQYTHIPDAQRVNDLMAALEPLANLEFDRCPWCDEESWYGDDHMEQCPVAVARRTLLGLN